MSRRKRQDLAPSLFPFLAVLVCTLGTLILLLALLVQNSATAAEQRARQQLLREQQSVADLADRPTVADAAAMIDEAEFHIQTAEKIRDQQAAAIEARRDTLTHLEDHIGRLQAELRRLSREIESATGQGNTDEVESNTIAMLRDQIAAEQLAVEKLRQQRGSRAPRVVIVPHKGPNGTTRRPIYVECNADGLTIWPEGVKIANEQLVGRNTRLTNPLDAALRVARLHAMKVYGDSDPPYPLLVVRPTGENAFAAATSAMDDWDDQYGYEMLDTGIELAFTAPDANLKRRMEEAIQQAMARQAERRTVKVVPLSASQLSRDGRSRGFGDRPGHPYGSGSGAVGDDELEFQQQANRLNEIYRDAAQELRARDGHANQTAMSESATGESVSDSDPKPGSPPELAAAERAATTTAENGTATGARSGTGGSDPTANSNRQIEAIGTPSTTMNEPPAGSQDQMREPPPSVDIASPPPASKTKLVHRDGDNWALPANVTNATGITIVRPIRVQFFADRFVIPASRSDATVVIPINRNLDRASLELATALHDRIKRWGVALDNGRWHPQLEIEFFDGTADQDRQLRKLLDGSGIEIKPQETK
jgi:hypothetical protein